MVSLVENANRFLYEAMRVHPGLREMGTTIAGVLVTTDTVTVFHVGDSRVYPSHWRGSDTGHGGRLG